MQRIGMAILLTFAIATGLQARVEQPSISSPVPSIDLTPPNCESSQDAYICVFLVTPDGTLLRAHIITAEKPLIRAFLRDIQYGQGLNKLSELSDLEHLGLYHCWSIKPNDLDTLRKLVKLKTLILERIRVTASGITFTKKDACGQSFDFRTPVFPLTDQLISQVI